MTPHPILAAHGLEPAVTEIGKRADRLIIDIESRERARHDHERGQAMTALDVLVDRVRDGKEAHLPEAMAVALRRRLTETERSRLTVDRSPASGWVFVSLWPVDRVVLTDGQGFTVRADILGRTAEFGPAGDRLSEWGFVG